MTAEQIIDRLLDERKITSKEAIILLKAIAKEVVQQWIPTKNPSDATTNWPHPNNITTVMYGVVPPNVVYNERDKNIETTFWVSDHSDKDDL